MTPPFHNPPVLDYRTQRTDVPHPPEGWKVLGYAIALSGCWMVLFGSLACALRGLFFYTNSATPLSGTTLLSSLAALGLAIGMGMCLYVLRPKR